MPKYKYKLVKRKVFTPMGKPDKPVYDIMKGKKVYTPAISYRLGRKFVAKLNKTKRRSK